MEVEATGFTLEQLKIFGTTETRFTVPQLSVEPLLTCAGVIVAVPAEFSCTIMFWQIAVGGTSSNTVIVLDTGASGLPHGSVAVHVCVTDPTHAVGVGEKVEI